MAKLPWEISWSEEQTQVLYRDWGISHFHREKFGTALRLFDKSYELKQDDPKLLYRRSICHSVLGNPEAALKDAFAALEINPRDHFSNLQVCDATYLTGNLAIARKECFTRGRNFKNSKKQPFDERAEMLKLNLDDLLGDKSIPFLIKNSGRFNAIMAELTKRDKVDPRPLWKILKEQDQCDVLSNLEIAEKKLNPRERCRRDENLRIFIQIYLRKGWIDYFFITKCQLNKDILSLPQTLGSTSYLNYITDKQSKITLAFIKSLHAKETVYSYYIKMKSNVKLATKITEAHLYRVQYQTRRDMFKALEVSTKLRSEGNLKGLLKYIEPIMGIKMSTKTLRVMPRKFEFFNEIYNIVALAYTDRIKVPENIKSYPAGDRIYILLDLPVEREKPPQKKAVFGKRSSFQDTDAPDYSYMAYKSRLNEFEERLLHATISVERCYLYHEIVQNHLKQMKMDEGRSIGRKIIDEANGCNSIIWMTLGALALVKCDILQRKIEKARESLAEAIVIASRLHDPYIKKFFQLCIQTNQKNIDMKNMVSQEITSKESLEEEYEEF